MATSLSSKFYFLLLLLVSQILAVAVECRRHDKSGVSPPIFIFGDSFFDSGNNNYINTTTLDQANFWPYGETFFKFPTGRFSDGRHIADFIAEFAKVALVPPFLQLKSENRFNYNAAAGVNFASAGAGALVQTFQGSVIPLKTQLKFFKEVSERLRHQEGKTVSKKTLSRSIYLFAIGTNDYISPFLTNSTSQFESIGTNAYVSFVISNLTSVIKDVYKIGGRKFGFLNLGPLGCLPALRILDPKGKGQCIKQATELAQLHNEVLYEVLQKLEKEMEGFKYSLYDFNSALKLRMDYPLKYGLREGKSACCGTGEFRGVFSCGGKRVVKTFQLCSVPKDYVFWDSLHLTESVYKQMAGEMWSGSTILPSFNLKQLFQSN
ncbi:GDSL esterase/lipase 5 [Impatiens glandulifera]|uniref:GDSL esterase/lipase 5 n=1 Tax=Impatiens glandulifera TaxID=253017 RepID=UPI001FB0E0E1|nr:GDSL esterase/lipase 5 [Impatiens glandulifera]